MADRRKLAGRRTSVLVNFEHNGIQFNIGYSLFDEHAKVPEPAEIFVTPLVAESHLHQECATFSTVVSLALQFGVPLKTLRDALPKHSNGKPTTWQGEALAVLARDLEA